VRAAAGKINQPVSTKIIEIAPARFMLRKLSALLFSDQ
jgi:hypothetical protein